MSPPVGWHLALEDGLILLYKNGKLLTHESGPDAGKEYGSVKSVTSAKVGFKELLRVSLEYYGVILDQV